MKREKVTCVKVAVTVAFVVVLGMTRSVEAGDFSRPIEVRNPSQLPGQLTAERIFLGSGYKPSMALLPDGELVIIALQNEGSGPTYHEFSNMARSSDNGQTWSAWQRVAKSPGQDLLGREQWLSVIDDGIPGNDDIMFSTSHLLSNDMANSAGYIHALVARSTDGGQTWTQIAIGPSGWNNPSTLPSRNIVKMPDGTLLFGASILHSPGTENYVYTSSDLGLTWQQSLQVTLPSYTNFEGTTMSFQDGGGLFHESWLYLNEANELVNNIRLGVGSPLFPIESNPPSGSDQPGRMILTTSADGGMTWSELVDVGTPEQEGYGQHYQRVLKLNDGRLMMTFTKRHVDQPLGLRAVFSHDDGQTWDFDNDHLIIDQNTPVGLASGGGFGNTLQLADSSLISTYSYHDFTTGNLNYQTEVVLWSLPPITPTRTWNRNGSGDWNAAIHEHLLHD